MSGDTTTAAREIAARYSLLAREYDALWSPVIRPMAQPMFAALRGAAGRLVLDVGCGTGAIAEDARSAFPGATIVGADLATGMVRRAAGEGRLRGLVADAAFLPVRSASVDCAYTVFVLQHVPDPRAAIAEMGRAIAPGGVGASVTWGEGKDAVVEEAMAGLLDRFGAPALPATVDSTPMLDTPEKMTELWEAAGLGAVRAWAAELEYRWTPETLVAVTTGYGRSKIRFESLDAGARERFVAAARAACDAMPDHAWIWRPVVVTAIACRP